MRPSDEYGSTNFPNSGAHAAHGIIGNSCNRLEAHGYIRNTLSLVSLPRETSLSPSPLPLPALPSRSTFVAKDPIWPITWVIRGTFARSFPRDSRRGSGLCVVPQTRLIDEMFAPASASSFLRRRNYRHCITARLSTATLFSRARTRFTWLVAILLHALPRRILRTLLVRDQVARARE